MLSGNVVLTADVHDVKALTYGFEDAAAKLKELGYTKVQVLGKDGFTPVRCKIIPEIFPPRCEALRRFCVSYG